MSFYLSWQLQPDEGVQVFNWLSLKEPQIPADMQGYNVKKGKKLWCLLSEQSVLQKSVISYIKNVTN